MSSQAYITKAHELTRIWKILENTTQIDKQKGIFFYKNELVRKEYSLVMGTASHAGCYQRFLDALRSLSFSEAYGEVAGNAFVFFVVGLMRGVVAGVAVAVPLDVLPFRLLDFLGLVRIGWLGVCCRGI